jgi:hypothetical protein
LFFLSQASPELDSLGSYLFFVLLGCIGCHLLQLLEVVLHEVVLLFTYNDQALHGSFSDIYIWSFASIKKFIHYEISFLVYLKVLCCIIDSVIHAFDSKDTAIIGSGID